METTNRQSDFNFSVFLHNFRMSFRRMFWIPLLLALALGGFGYVRTQRSYTPVYQAKAVYIVSSNYAESTDISLYSYLYDSNAASRLTSTFPYILETDAAKQMTYRLTGSYRLPASVTGASMADSNIFTITVQGGSYAAVQQTLDVVVAIYPQAAANILGNITLEPLEAPEFPTEPINRPASMKTCVKYALVGLVAGLALIALAAYLRKTVHTSEDLRRLVNTPCIGMLPSVRFKARTGADTRVLLTNPRIPDAYVDAANALRFKLKKELERQSAQVIMVTSTNPSEGKSTVAANLALAMAAQGSRVILVDADLRKPSQKEIFGIHEPSEGLAELVASSAEKISPIAVPGTSLLLLSGEKTADQPQRFLASHRMRKILASLKEQMDYIILDTPPCGFLSDAATLAPYVDGVIYVVRQDYVSCAAIADSMQALSATDVRFLGCVINNAERGTAKHGYGAKNYGYGAKYYGKKQPSDEVGEEYQK